MLSVASPSSGQFPGILFWLQRLHQLGERCIVLRRVLVPSPEVPHPLGDDVGFALVLPVLENVVIEPDGKQRVPAFLILTLQGALGLTQNGPAVERLVGRGCGSDYLKITGRYTRYGSPSSAMYPRSRVAAVAVPEL